MLLATFLQQENAVVSRVITLTRGVRGVRNFSPVDLVIKTVVGLTDLRGQPVMSMQKHKDTCRKLKACNTQAGVHAIEVETGIKYSVLIELDYFDPIRFTIVDPMHNLFLGTATVPPVCRVDFFVFFGVFCVF